MQNLLEIEYGLNIKSKINDSPYPIYKDEHLFYLVVPNTEKQSSLMERAALTHFLHGMRYSYVAFPIQTKTGNWTVNSQGEEMVVCAIPQYNNQQHYLHGKQLAEFHRIGTNYPYEPQNISSYGHWRNLWINKLTGFEALLYERSKTSDHHFYSVVMDILPYIIGISENAIQYIRESEEEPEFDDIDKGTITFYRYENQLKEEFILSTELSYDHPVRDIAEYIRTTYLLNDEGMLTDCVAFLEEYQTIRSLSTFSWRQLYGRLLYPVHFFDCIAVGLNGDIEKELLELNRLIDYQHEYEKRLHSLFNHLEQGRFISKIPKVSWISRNE